MYGFWDGSGGFAVHKNFAGRHFAGADVVEIARDLSAMDLSFKNELALLPDLGQQLRRLRWFRATFRANARAISAAYGLRFDIDDTKLARAFLDWIEIVEKERRLAAIDRADFIQFAAGLVLRELIRHGPVKAAQPDGAWPQPDTDMDMDMAEIARFWPEGFLYTNYCVSAIAAIHEQEFGKAPSLDACADDLRTWWSYRENASEMPAYAVAFLDRFLGTEPDWIRPDSALSREAMRQALDAGSASRGIAGR